LPEEFIKIHKHQIKLVIGCSTCAIMKGGFSTASRSNKSIFEENYDRKWKWGFKE